MRLMYILPFGFSLIACASAPDSVADTVEPPNPEIVKRIEVRLEENKEQPAPQLQDIPSAGPELPSAEVLAQERAALLAEQAALKEGVADVLSTDDEEALARKAEALKVRIAKDRELMEAEGLLSKEGVSKPSLDQDGQ